jgi:hypothetical protein
VTGKKKSNAAVVMGETALCHITAPDGAVFKIRGCVRVRGAAKPLYLRAPTCTARRLG